MPATDIVLSNHARMQMQRRGVSLEDVALTLQHGKHVEGQEEGTGEACVDELDGRPLTVVYDSLEHQFKGVFCVINVVRRRCLL